MENLLQFKFEYRVYVRDFDTSLTYGLSYILNQNLQATEMDRKHFKRCISKQLAKDKNMNP